tara:strand:- start:93 stop:458 length:366 start_codon:yes stop_codon:yes gene_type:complete
MQAELSSEYPMLDISILAINQIGAEAGIPQASQVGTLPIVNDDSNTQIWTNWTGIWRDVYIVDHQNEVVDVYNLTANNLAPNYGVCSVGTNTDQESCEAAGAVWTSNYDYLKQLFVTAALQ